MQYHILVIDDDDEIRQLLAKYLNKNGYIVSLASSTAIAQELLELFQFDLVILDVLMPKETGLEFLKRKTLRQPVIMLTALGDVDDRINGLAIYNSEVNVVTPLTILNNIINEFDKLIQLLNDNRINALIIGYPLHLSGNETAQTEEIKRFAGMLAGKINLPIILSDERFTTSLANTLLKEANLKRKIRNKMDDMVSASILLENFFY